MWRFLAGAGSALLLAGAGFAWWSSGERGQPALIGAPGLAAAGAPGVAEPPQADEKTREQKRFDRYDKDRNEAVSRDEYLASRVKAFERLDLDRDGRLSFDEWAKKTTDKFAGADGDRDGRLDRQEFATTRVVRKGPPRKADCPPPAAAGGEGEEG